jgi:type II secretory ATPase GspE/PulE/Tfp pilus assembly ATPase PilB-like protein
MDNFRLKKRHGVRSNIEQAFRQRVFDNHTEPLESKIRERFWVDGIFSEAISHQAKFLPAIITRNKIMSEMDWCYFHWGNDADYGRGINI